MDELTADEKEFLRVFLELSEKHIYNTSNYIKKRQEAKNLVWSIRIKLGIPTSKNN